MVVAAVATVSASLTASSSSISVGAARVPHAVWRSPAKLRACRVQAARLSSGCSSSSSDSQLAQPLVKGRKTGRLGPASHKPRQSTVVAAAAAAPPKAGVTWEQLDAAEPPTARSGHVTVPLPDSHPDDVLVFGGYVEYEPSMAGRKVNNDAYVLNIAEKRWKRLDFGDQELPEPRLTSQAVVVGDTMWLLAGWNPNNRGGEDEFLDDVWTLDLHNYKWRRVHLQGSQMPRISRFQAVAVGDKIYIHNHRSVDSVCIIDTSKETLQKSRVAGNVPSSRGLHNMVHVNNKLWVFGGADNSGLMNNDVHYLDLDTMIWTKPEASGNWPSPRAAAGAAALHNKVFVFGGACRANGSDVNSGGLVPLDDLHALDTESCRWETVQLNGSTKPGPRNAAQLVAKDGKLVIYGGWKPFVQSYSDTHILHL